MSCNLINNNYEKNDKRYFENLKKNITVSFNLCSNQQVLSWGYHVQNNCQDKYGYYYWSYDTLKQKFGVENLALAPNYLNPNSCTPCSCDSVLFFPELNLCSKLSIVLLTQNNAPLQIEYDFSLGRTYLYPNNQMIDGLLFASKIPLNGETNCFIESSVRSKYYIWKAIINSPLQCSQKVEFELLGQFYVWDLFDLNNGWNSNYSYNYIYTDLARVENMISKYLD